jgi:hypothetical protein
MTVKYRALFLLTCLCACQTSVMAESKPLELKWTELAPMISGHRVELVLNEGTTVSGEAAAVREDTLVVDVSKSSGTKQYAKGNAAIPRNSINLIKLQRSSGGWGRTLGTVIGVVAGMGIGGYTAAHMDSAGPAIAVVVAVTSATAVAGYYAGRNLDRRVTLIRILP